jgi:hypothetical protein
MVGVTGFEPVTLRLSSACSNQLSYTPMRWLGHRRRLHLTGSGMGIVACGDLPIGAALFGRRTLTRHAVELRSTPHGLWWRHGDSNPRPIACKATALPTELCPQVRIPSPSPRLGIPKQKLNCALPFQISEAPVAFASEVLNGMSSSEELSLAVDLCKQTIAGPKHFSLERR